MFGGMLSYIGRMLAENQRRALDRQLDRAADMVKDQNAILHNAGQVESNLYQAEDGTLWGSADQAFEQNIKVARRKKETPTGAPRLLTVLIEGETVIHMDGTFSRVVLEDGRLRLAWRGPQPVDVN